MITNDERREIAAEMRKNADDNVIFIGTIVADEIGTCSFKDAKCWNRLADLIEPDNIPDNADGNAHGLSGSCDRDALLDLADIMEGHARFFKERSIRVGNNLVECYAGLIREAVNACESDSDAPAAGDREQAATDAHADGNEAADGARTPSIEVIRWVNEHGGLDEVKRQRRDSVPRAAYERNLAKRQRQVDESHAALRRRNRWIAELEHLLCKEMSYSLRRDAGCLAPEALDADGVEIREGDTVWHVETGEQCKVVEVDSRSVSVDFRVDGDGTKHTGSILPANLTHRAPVLAADGRPLREGETVYKLDDDRPYTLKRFDGEHVYINAGGRSFDIWTFPNKLTHERPESKCRDCAHWQKDPTADNMGVCWFFYHEYEGQDCYAARRADIGACEEFMPRAKKLAGVSE